MPNGESREGLEDVYEQERQYVGRAVRDMSVEEMIAEMRDRVVPRLHAPPPPTTDPRLPVFREPEPTEPRFKIPKGFTPLHPLINTTTQPDEKPEHLLRTDRVRYVLRSGEKGSNWVSHLWWGDSPRQTGAIVAYKKLKKESPWVDWGNLHRLTDLRDHPIHGTIPDIARLNSTLTTPELVVWLRDFNRPVGYVRRADAWDWGLDGTGNDIMRYRLAGEEDESITRI